MKTYCLNCGHKHTGSTCPKCGVTLNNTKTRSNIRSAHSIPAPSARQASGTSSIPGTSPNHNKVQQAAQKTAPVRAKAAPSPQMPEKKVASKKRKRSFAGIIISYGIIGLMIITIVRGILPVSPEEAEEVEETEDKVKTVINKEPFYEEGEYYQISSSYYGYETFLKTFTEDESGEENADYTGTFTKGVYMAGYHFPPGNYKIFEESSPYDVLEERYSFGNILVYIGNGTLNLSANDADMVSVVEMKENPAKEEITLSTGEYIAGEDFDEGIYDIVRKGEKGHTYLWIGDDFEPYVNSEGTELKNVPLPDGTSFEVGGTDVVLKPCEL